MTNETNFDDIRPYTDDEVPAAMERIASSASFPLLASYVFPGKDLGEVAHMVRDIRTVDEFQARVMAPMNERVIETSIDEFSFSGLERLSPDCRYLFISNHRDIVLDSSLMQYVLFTHGHPTSEITFGANLMQGQLIVDIGKSNKMFRVERPSGNIKEFYLSSCHLSRYIRHALLEKRQSVWIAQRNGRTKDGIDQTDQGIIKMLGMSRSNDKVEAIAALNIVPIAISYEWEPCDVLKALELYEKRQMGHYVKKPGEDVNSIITGIVQPKGKVHLGFCKPLELGELDPFRGMTLVEFNRAVAALIDRRIQSEYRLMPNNFIAHDLRHGKNAYQHRYTAEQQSAFLNRLSSLGRFADDCDVETLTDIWLGIYSSPVDFVPH